MTAKTPRTAQVPKTDRTRVHFRETQHIHATPTDIFPLLCPVREFDWIPSWDCEIVYTESGVAETGCVFQTGGPDDPGGIDTWVISRYQPTQGVSFIRVNSLRTIRYDIDLQAEGNGSTTLLWRQEITALSDAGDAHVAAQSPEDFSATIRKVEQMLDHYLQHGEPFRIEYAGT